MRAKGGHRAGDYRARDVKPLESQTRLSWCQLRPFPLELFGKPAETCEMVKKGAKVLVEGKLDVSDYTDKEGQKRMTFRVLADTYRLL